MLYFKQKKKTSSIIQNVFKQMAELSQVSITSHKWQSKRTGTNTKVKTFLIKKTKTIFSSES